MGKVISEDRDILLIERLDGQWWPDTPSNLPSLRQEEFHTETTATGIFEFGGIADDRLESLFSKDDFQLRAGVRLGVAAVDDDSVSHEVVGLLRVVTRHHEFSVFGFLANEQLIGREHHVLETFNGFDGFNLASILLQNVTELFPLAARFRAVDSPVGK